MRLDRIGPPGRCSRCWPHDGEVAGADLVLLISGPPALTLFLAHMRAREGADGSGLPVATGSASPRPDRTSWLQGAPGVLSLRHFGLMLLIPWAAWVPTNLARRKMVSAARCGSTGSGRLGGAAAAGRTMERSPAPI